MKRLILCVFLLFKGIFASESQADLIIFSFDRPLQLYALLESVEKYAEGIGKIVVVYRTSNHDFQDAYCELLQRFSKVHFIHQIIREYFKSKTIEALECTSSSFILFAVDDIVVKDTLDISHCVRLLDNSDAFGFYLRLGFHLDYCYTSVKVQSLPVLYPFKDDTYYWYFQDSEGDWAFPFSLDMSIYRRNDIARYLTELNYMSPNSLEIAWYRSSANTKGKGLCFEQSKVINLPLNVVQTVYQNRCMDGLTTDMLLDIFKAGKKINILPYYRIENKSVHVAFLPEFIER